jgi:hypothetical protein
MSLMPMHVLGGVLLGLALATPRSAEPTATTDCSTIIRGYIDWMAGSRLGLGRWARKKRQTGVGFRGIRAEHQP